MTKRELRTIVRILLISFACMGILTFNILNK